MDDGRGREGFLWLPEVERGQRGVKRGVRDSPKSRIFT